MKVGDMVRVTNTTYWSGPTTPGRVLDTDSCGVLVEFAPDDTRWLAEHILEAIPQPPDLAMRHNEGKPELNYALTFGDALREMSKVCTYGAGKYARANYIKGAPLSQSVDCLLRHLLAWWEGEDTDPESGQGHLAHVVWNALRLCQESLVRKDLDDRISYHRGLSDERPSP